MLLYIFKRLLLMIPILIGVTLIVFTLIRIKGDPVLQLVPDYYTDEQIEEVRRTYGFDRPVFVQYFDFLFRAVQGDFGQSFRNRQPAWDMVMKALPYTAHLGITSLLLAIVVAVPLGVVSALKRNSPIDLFVTAISVGGRAVPGFWLAIMLILLFAVTFRLLPVSGTGATTDQPYWKHLILPALTLSTGMVTTFTRLIRSSMLEVLKEDYVKTARAKGLPEHVVILNHAMRNALIPVVTVLGLNVAWLLGGAVIIEQIFAWPGMGRLMVDAIFARDNAVVQAGLFVTSLIVMASNLIVDVLYSFLDPRIATNA
jgi:peptide/nickel transport system permease protein